MYHFKSMHNSLVRSKNWCQVEAVRRALITYGIVIHSRDKRIFSMS